MFQVQKSVLRIFAFSALVITCLVARAALPSPTGDWTTIDDKSHKPKSVVRLSVSGDQLNGKIIKVYKENVPYPEDNCFKCKGALKDQPIIGLPVVQGLSENDDGSWSGGTITDPETGNVYKCTITPSADGKTLDVRGYIGVSLLGRTQTWEKAK